MKSAFFTIFKKELKRFFSDKRMFITTLLLPGLLIFVMYNFMGSAMTNIIGGEDETYSAAAVNMPESIKILTEQSELGINIGSIDIDDIEEVKENIAESVIYDACIVFPKDFDIAVSEYDSRSGGKAPQVEIYYNSSSVKSYSAFQILSSVLDAYESSLANKFDINAGNGVYDLSSEEDLTGTIFSMMMPMLLMMFLYSGCVAVGVESIAGEKERGTIATMLVTPAKRSRIAMGKIAALSIIALLSGTISAVCTVSSLPKLMGDESELINGSVYGVTDYILLAVVILSTVLVMITLVSVASAFASSVKEAQTYILPIMMINLAAGISGMFGSTQGNPALYLIPLYNSAQSMTGIFSFDINYTNLIITVLANLIFTGLGVAVLTKLFNSEKIMFSK